MKITNVEAIASSGPQADQRGNRRNYVYVKVVIGEFPKQRDGYFDLPTGPGVGLDMDEAALRANPPIAQNPPEGYVKAGLSMWGSKQETTWS